MADGVGCYHEDGWPSNVGSTTTVSDWVERRWGLRMREDDPTLTPRAISDRFTADRLTGQFLLSKHQVALPWSCDSVGEWHLWVEENLPCVEIRSEHQKVGWLLGHAVGGDGKMVAGELQVQSDRIEDDVYALGGRFLAILPLLERVYLDPCGLLSAVYCEQLQIVASSPNLIPYDDLTKDRTDLLTRIGIPFAIAMFPVGMTPRHAVERVVPNHYLDLRSWRTERHWPDRALDVVEDVSATVAEIASIAKQQIGAVVDDGPTTLNLTAGKDSRMLLACARNVASSLECQTFDLNDEPSRNDLRVARKVSRIAGVPHHTLTWMEPEDDDLQLWLYRTGFGTGEYRGWTGTTTLRRQMDSRRSTVYGAAGELARGIYWLPDDSPNTEITTERLLKNCSCPATPETVSRMEQWKSGADMADSLQLLDLFYVEQRLGSWAGVWTYGQAEFSRYDAFPLSHRRIMELMMRLPIDMRRSGALHSEVIRQEWPELLKYGFSQRTIPRRAWRKAKRVLAANAPRRTRRPGPP